MRWRWLVGSRRDRMVLDVFEVLVDLRRSRVCFQTLFGDGGGSEIQVVVFHLVVSGQVVVALDVKALASFRLVGRLS